MNKKITVKEKPKEVVKTKTLDEIRDSIKDSAAGYDAWYILRQADKEMKDFKGPKEIATNTNYYKAMTLFEFDKGVLLLNSIPELHGVFALEFSKNLQAEYNCKTPSEKSMAEITSLNFVRILEIQRRISNILSNMKTRYEVQYLAILSKELDRAERHYLTSLQALKMLRSPAFEVNIKTQTAVVGANQIIQANNRQNKPNNS